VQWDLFVVEANLSMRVLMFNLIGVKNLAKMGYGEFSITKQTFLYQFLCS